MVVFFVYIFITVVIFFFLRVQLFVQLLYPDLWSSNFSNELLTPNGSLTKQMSLLAL